MARREWAPIMAEAKRIVLGYNYSITLRQLHYRLVMSTGLGYTNSEGDYKRLSDVTAVGRRARSFPNLLDQTRSISQPDAYTSVKAALGDMSNWFRGDRTKGQLWQVVLAGEKATLLAQLENWFLPYGMPIVLLRGYASQTYCDLVRDMVQGDGRKSVLIYAGDLDPSGENILEDFLSRCPVWDEVEHIAVQPAQITTLNLTVAPGKMKDPRAAGFIAKHGRLVQVEVEAIDPADLEALYQDAIDRHWDRSAFDASVAQEKRDRARIAWLADQEP